MIKAIIKLDKYPSKELQQELSVFDDVSCTFRNKKVKNCIVLRYKNNDLKSNVWSQELGLSSSEIQCINTLGMISRKYNLKITFWA